MSEKYYYAGVDKVYVDEDRETDLFLEDKPKRSKALSEFKSDYVSFNQKVKSIMEDRGLSKDEATVVAWDEKRSEVLTNAFKTLGGL